MSPTWLSPVAAVESFETMIVIDEKDYQLRAVSYLPNIFECLEADVLGGEAFSEKRVHAYFTCSKFSEVGKSSELMNS